MGQYVSGIAGLYMSFGSKGKEIARRKEAGGFLLGLRAQWHMDNHFIPVKISRKALASQRAQLNRFTGIRRQWNRMECLEAVAVQGRLPVQQHHKIRV